MQPSVRLTQDLGRQSEISTPQAIGFLQTTEPSFRVLVAEALDSHSQLLLLVEQLGYQANAVKDGAAVGQAMQQQHFDLLLLDTNLPNLTLFQAILNTDTGLMLEPQTGIAVFTWATDAPSNNTAKLNTEKTSPNQQPETNAFSPGQSPEPQLKLQACLSHPATLAHLHALLRTLEARHLQAFEQDPIVRQYQTILTRKLPDFLQRASRLILTIQNAVLHQDTQALGTAAHVLKGLAASFQFHQLSDTCERLEHMVELKTLSDSEAYMNQLYQQLSGLQPH
jgi:CheY-like chemotaxis protein